MAAADSGPRGPPGPPHTSTSTTAHLVCEPFFPSGMYFSGVTRRTRLIDARVQLSMPYGSPSGRQMDLAQPGAEVILLVKESTRSPTARTRSSEAEAGLYSARRRFSITRPAGLYLNASCQEYRRAWRPTCSG